MQKRKNTLCLIILLSAILVFFSVSCKDEITQPQPSVLTPDIIHKLQAAADKVMMNNQIPGMLAYVCLDGEREGVYITRGVSNLVTTEPMNVNNTWRIGSLTKMITSEAVLILVDEGLIDLSKPISFYLPELKIPGGDKVTIPMLANMTSGLYSYTDDSVFMQNYINSHGQLTYTPGQLDSIAFSHDKRFDPGMGFYYYNTNYVLLGLLIQKVTGKSVSEVVDIQNLICNKNNDSKLNTLFSPSINSHLKTDYAQIITHFLQIKNSITA